MRFTFYSAVSFAALLAVQGQAIDVDEDNYMQLDEDDFDFAQIYNEDKKHSAATY